MPALDSAAPTSKETMLPLPPSSFVLSATDPAAADMASVARADVAGLSPRRDKESAELVIDDALLPHLTWEL